MSFRLALQVRERTLIWHRLPLQTAILASALAAVHASAAAASQPDLEAKREYCKACHGSARGGQPSRPTERFGCAVRSAAAATTSCWVDPAALKAAYAVPRIGPRSACDRIVGWSDQMQRNATQKHRLSPPCLAAAE